MDTQRAYIGIGSNMGRRRANCRSAIQNLEADAETSLIKRSSGYLTEPVDYADQDCFVNYVVAVDTLLDPFALLERLQAIQRQAGRIHDPVRFGPRIIDLDLLLYADRIIRAAGLVVPHPRMHKRRFVLRPICDIDPGIVHPVLKRDMHSLLAELPPHTQRIVKIND
jgi:2-amino-4-hydroxy-6-hydroxymethyldihydropteridine diphosphokinase